MKRMRPIPLKKGILGHKRPETSPKIKKFAKSNAQQVCISGPRKCSKSFTIINYLLWLHQETPNLISYVVRSERRTIADSIFKTILKQLKYPYKKHAKNPFFIDGGLLRPNKIVFDNGGEMVFGGMDDSSKVLGSEMHLCFYNQVERELKEQHWADLIGCMVDNRAGPIRLPKGEEWDWRLISDANPSIPTHWLRRRKDEGTLEWYDFLLEDHPHHYNWVTKEWTERGKQAEADLLEAYPPGFMRERMVYGRWVGAVGMVFPEYYTTIIDELPDVSAPHWKHYRGFDFGYDDPFNCLWSATNPDNGTLVVYKEHKSSGKDILDHIPVVKQHSENIDFEWSIADHDPSDCSIMEREGITTRPAIKDVRLGIHLLNKRIADGKLKIFKNLLIQKDPRLIEKNLPTDVIGELGQYMYPEKKTGNPKHDDQPSKGNDHGIDPLRYKIVGLDKPNPAIKEPLSESIESPNPLWDDIQRSSVNVYGNNKGYSL